MLEAIDLQCERGHRRLFDRLSFALAAGQCTHIVGDNGAGKTSLLRILCGLLRQTHGEVRWHGRRIDRVRDEYGADLAYVGHLNGVKDDLTAAENLRTWAAMSGRRVGSDRVAQALRLLAIGEFGQWPAGHLSQGQKRRIGLARLALADPARIWILDEPFNALDRHGVETLNGLIEQHVHGGGAVILTTHQAWQAPVPIVRLELGTERVG
ncbi:MAG TPA: cytochrome c biogenesis heme-transporting ATPase CcmA [Burkholderiaceae bacterium]|nr:cytochrome c biogenesis heme-transporting ATPase CcmA [Burkholderiaceae bacterium]